MAKGRKKVNQRLRRWLNELWCQHVTGEPLPRLDLELESFNAGLWKETAAAYLSVLRELGIERKERLAWEVSRKRPGSRTRAAREVNLINAFAEQLRQITRAGESTTPLAARRNRHLDPAGANLALGALLASSGLPVAAAVQRDDPALLISLTTGDRWYVGIGSILNEVTSVPLEVKGQMLAPDIICYELRRYREHIGACLPPILWELPFDQAALYTIAQSVTSPQRASSVPRDRSRLAKARFYRMAKMLSPAIWNLVQHPTWQADQRGFEKDLKRSFVFVAVASKMPWEAVEHYGLSGVWDRYEDEISTAIFGKGPLPPELPPGLAAKIKEARDECLAGQALPALQAAFDLCRRLSGRGKDRPEQFGQ